MNMIVAGLGRMGMQIARKLAEDGHNVIGYNPSAAAIEEAEQYGVRGAHSPAEAVKLAGTDERVIVWLMVPSGVIDEAIDEWSTLLPAGSLLIDGGNSDYRGDEARAERVRHAGHELMDIGTSGGVWGYQRGFCMMVGGEQASYDELAPLLDTLAAPSGTHAHFGANGAGHYVKMVHNAIEYGMMQSLAEGYRMLKDGPIAHLDLAKAGETWQHSSVITSWLNELSAEAVAESPELEAFPGVVAESGEARWTLETAKDLGIELPAIQAAFDVRLASQAGKTDFSTKLLAAMRHRFGGHDTAGRF